MDKPSLVIGARETVSPVVFAKSAKTMVSFSVSLGTDEISNTAPPGMKMTSAAATSYAAMLIRRSLPA
jgi:hypothetical protein